MFKAKDNIFYIIKSNDYYKASSLTLDDFKLLIDQLILDNNESFINNLITYIIKDLDKLKYIIPLTNDKFNNVSLFNLLKLTNNIEIIEYLIDVMYVKNDPDIIKILNTYLHSIILIDIYDTYNVNFCNKIKYLSQKFPIMKNCCIDILFSNINLTITEYYDDNFDNVINIINDFINFMFEQYPNLKLKRSMILDLILRNDNQILPDSILNTLIKNVPDILKYDDDIENRYCELLNYYELHNNYEDSVLNLYIMYYPSLLNMNIYKIKELFLRSIKNNTNNTTKFIIKHYPQLLIS